MGGQIKISLYSYFSFHLPAIQPLISAWEKSYKDIAHSPRHVSVITGDIMVITIIRFSRYHPMLASKSTFMADSHCLGTIQI